MRVVLFGGAFNPPHLGHLLVMQQAFELIADMDRLWIMPCYQHTFQKELAPVPDRLAMTVQLMENLPESLKQRVDLETCEIDRQLSGETHETLKLLKQQHPDHHFSFLMGSDQLHTFTQWGKWQQLLESMPFYVYPRNGYTEPVTLPNMTLLSAETQVITNLSSQLIRQRLAQNLPLTNLVPKSVLDYLAQSQLYRS